MALQCWTSSRISHTPMQLPRRLAALPPGAPENVLKVTVAPEAAAVLERRGDRFRELCLNVVSGDPRPAYQRISGREYQCYLEDCEIVWQAGEQPDEARIIRVNEHATPRPMPPKVF